MCGFVQATTLCVYECVCVCLCTQPYSVFMSGFVRVCPSNQTLCLLESGQATTLCVFVCVYVWVCGNSLQARGQQSALVREPKLKITSAVALSEGQIAAYSVGQGHHKGYVFACWTFQNRSRDLREGFFSRPNSTVRTNIFTRVVRCASYEQAQNTSSRGVRKNNIFLEDDDVDDNIDLGYCDHFIEVYSFRVH